VLLLRTYYYVLTKINPQCLTADGRALTRVCIIDFATSKVMYDQLVKPPSPITDYLTRYVYQSRTSFVPHPIFSFSGITAQALEPITTTLVDVQAHLRTLLTPSTILLGHSLESDLHALQLAHPRCIDTALLFHHPRGRPLKPGLAWLARKWLGRTIQNRGPGGHDPEEDARACMDLLKAKIKNGPGFGEFRTDYEPILARIARSQSRGPNGAGPRAAIVDHGNPGAWHGTSPAAPATTVACTNDAEVLDGVLSVLDTHEFVFARLMGLADALGWVTPKAGADDTPTSEPPQNPNVAVPENDAKDDAADAPPSTAAPEQNGLLTAVVNLNAQLTALHAALPSRTAFLLFSGHSDPRAMSALAARRTQYQASQNQKGAVVATAAPATAAAGTGVGGAEAQAGAVRWSTADERALEEAVARARMGLLFVGVKP